MSARKRRWASPPRLVSAATSDVRPPPALTHGLTSHRMRVAMREDVEALIPAIIGAAYPDPPVVDAARAAAEAILHLHYVRHAKRSLIEEQRRPSAQVRKKDVTLALTILQLLDGTFKGDRDREIEEVLVSDNGKPVDDHADAGAAELQLASIITQPPKALRNMADYERRAISGRGKALRRLILEKIEAERRRQI